MRLARRRLRGGGKELARGKQLSGATAVLVDKLLAFARVSPHRINPSLEQMQTVLAALPQLRLRAPCVLIGGTNGKGTTAGFICSLLSHGARLKVGLYTSPHVSHFCERVQTSHVPLDDAALDDMWQELEPLLAPRFRAQLTFFECSTLLAFYVFNRTATDINILEVGLGGTWDAVNVCDPLAAAIVSIGKDHQQYLGNTYAEILRDKLGIARPHRPLFWGNQGSGADDADLQRTLQGIVQQRQLVLCSAGREFQLDADASTLRVALSALPQVTIPIPRAVRAGPRWLQRNFCLAFALSWWLLPCLGRSMSGFARAIDSRAELLPSTLPARFQVRRLCHRPTGQVRPLLLDACHNYDGALALVAELQQRYGVVAGMLSLLHDKEVAAIVPLLARQLNPLAIFALNNERSMTRAQVPPAQQHCWHKDVASAWHSVAAVPDARPLVICGSFYGLGEALALLAGHEEWELLCLS